MLAFRQEFSHSLGQERTASDQSGRANREMICNQYETRQRSTARPERTFVPNPRHF